MGMNLKTYLIVGYKTTWRDAEAEWGELFDGLLDEDFDDIVIISGEGSDTAIIGEIVADTDEYSNAYPVEVANPSGLVAHVEQRLKDIGVWSEQDVKLYLFGVWG